MRTGKHTRRRTRTRTRRLPRLSLLVTFLSLGLGVTAVLADSGTVDVEVADKTGYASDQTADGAIVEYIGDSHVTFGSSGSGIFEAFLRTHASPSETGYNSDLKKNQFEFDEVGGNFTNSILVSEIPVVECESVDGNLSVDDLCWELFADINDSNSTPLIQLTTLELYFSDTGSPTGYDMSSDWDDKVYDFEGSVQINDVNQGSGRGDLRYLVPLEGITIPENCAYGSSTCSTFFVLYTGWGDVAGGDYSTDAGFNEWKVKRYPFLDVTKTANTTFTRTFGWTIDKSVTPSTWDLFDGDTGTSDWTVAVTKDEGTDSAWAVSGTITIENPSDQDATIESVDDEISGVGLLAVDCGVTFPYLLEAGDTLTCSYGSALPDGTDRTNTATATLDTSQVFTGEADVDFGEPTTLVNDTVTVTDDRGGPLNESVNDDASFTYEETFACDADEGTHGNTATIVETSQSASASVTVTCYDLAVTKTADPSFDRDFDWTIVKTVDPDTLDLFNGDSDTVTWTVAWTKGPAEDSGFAVEGDITIVNNHPTLAADLTAVTDAISGVGAASVNCPALVVPAGGSLVCSYDSDLPDDQTRTNSATATQQNYDYASDGTPTADGTTVYSGNVSIDFTGVSPTVTDDTATITDDRGPLDRTESASGSTSYTETFTCDADEGSHVNTAVVTEDNSGDKDNDSATATVNCYELTVTKDADTSFTTTYDWTLDKQVSIDGGTNWVNSASVEISVGASQDYLWRLVATRSDGIDSDWFVEGVITISNPAPIDADDVSVSDVISHAIAPDIAATVDCDATTEGNQTTVDVPAAVGGTPGTATCSYSADLPNDDDRTNTATATLFGHDVSGTADVDFSTAVVTEVDESATLEDDEVPSADGLVITGSGTFVSGTNTFTCGETTTIVNIADLTENDSMVVRTDSADLTVTCVGKVQITPTGTECGDFLDDSATDLATLEINPSGNLAPGAFIHFAQLGVSGETTIEVSVESDNPADDAPTVNEAKIYAFDPETGVCMQISNQPGVTVSIVDNVATFHLDAAAAALYPDIVTYTKYSSGSGIVGTTYTFETTTDGSLELTDTLLVVDDQ